MNAVIVGHGPSVCDWDRGEDIDAHDVVIRLKRSADVLKRPEIFGNKTDVVCSSAVTWQDTFDMWYPRGCRVFWLFLDTRTFHVSDADIDTVRRFFAPAECVIDRKLCERWVEHYRRMRGAIALDARQEDKGTLSDERGHKHCSAGMFAVIHAMALLRPQRLDIVGFDNVATGTFDWSITRGPDWNQYPDHNWKTEARMLDEVAREYGYSVEREGKELRCNLNM